MPTKAIRVTVIIILTFPLFCWAAMSSSTYRINADSLNEGGGLSGSASYKINDTLGEAVIGEGASGSYKTKAGYQYMINTYLTLTVGSTAADLGTLIPGSPVTGQTIVSVTTDSWGGYALNVSKDHPMRNADDVTEIPDHNGTITTPLLWESPNAIGFGFTIVSGTGVNAKWGSNPNYKYAAFPLLATTAHMKSGYQNTADNTTIGYKADADNDQKGGAYSCTITYTAVAAL